MQKEAVIAAGAGWGIAMSVIMLTAMRNKATLVLSRSFVLLTLSDISKYHFAVCLQALQSTVHK